MGNILSYMKDNDYNIHIKYYGVNDFGTEHDLKSIIKGKDLLKSYYNKERTEEEFNFDSYVDYLVLEKIIKMEEIIPIITNEDNQNTMENLIEDLKPIYHEVDKGKQIKFINLNIEDIFLKYKDYFHIREVTLEKIIEFQGGIKKEVLFYLIQNHYYMVIDNYECLQKTIEKNADIAKMFFSKDILRNNITYRLEDICEIVISVNRREKKDLQEYLQNAIDVIMGYGNEIVGNLDIRNIMINHDKVKVIYNFAQKLKLLEANEYERYMEMADKLLNQHLEKHGSKIELGASFGHDTKIIVDEMIRNLKSEGPWYTKLISLTHSKKGDKIDSSLNQQLGREELSIMDFVSTNKETDDYFTLSYRESLELLVNLHSIIIFNIFKDKEALGNLHSAFYLAFNYIADNFSYDNKEILHDLGLLFTMIEKLFVESEVFDDYDIQSQSYSLSMFICSLTEKFMRITYKYIKENEEYVSNQWGTMGDYLNPNNEVMNKVLGEVQIRHLQFYFLRTSDSKIGFNYRNKLAHWNKITNIDCNKILVCRLFYLFLSTFNSILYYLVSETEK